MNGFLIFYICLVVIAVILANFYRSGKRALSIFPGINTVNIRYRDKYAAGHSVRSFRSRTGRANKSLDIVVTDQELWVRSLLLFAGIVQQYDLIHRIPLRKIKKAVNDGSKTIIDFTGTKGEQKQLVIITKDAQAFLQAMKVKTKQV